MDPTFAELFPEEEVYARHERVRGSVLIVGAGSVGGFIAEELAALGISPLHLVDRDVLGITNLIRHPLRPANLSLPKASALARQLDDDFPRCVAAGTDADFLALPRDVQFQLVSEADVVVVAVASEDCRKRLNALCIEAQVPAVYPAIWVSSDMRDAEVGEVYWTLPGRHTPCYECWLDSRRDRDDTEDVTSRGMRVDIMVTVLVATSVVRALLAPKSTWIGVLDRKRNLIVVHSFMPTSASVRGIFSTSGLRTRNVAVNYLNSCPVCGNSKHHHQTIEQLIDRWFTTLGYDRTGVNVKVSEASPGYVTASWVLDSYKYHARYVRYTGTLQVEVQIAPLFEPGCKRPTTYLANSREQLAIAFAEDQRRRIQQ
jgi:molybdopterin/thiamine biosynthesis adenylyltransferase